METKGTPPTAGDVQQQASETMLPLTSALLRGTPVGAPQLGMDPSGNPYFTQDVNVGGRVVKGLATAPSSPPDTKREELYNSAIATARKEHG
jgi:hypothetical protein